jgi:hypothetical protein
MRGNDIPEDPRASAVAPGASHRQASSAERVANAVVSSPFKASLEMKENVDFLLTPALVMQQAVSGDGAIIYPSE